MPTDVSPDALPFTLTDIEQTIMGRFDAVVNAFPGRIALTGGGQQWTYQQLDARANQVAHEIARRTPAAAGCIAYVIDQSPEMVIAAIAALKAGKHYLAVHPRLPADAQSAMLAAEAPHLVLTTLAQQARVRDVVGDRYPELALESIDDQVPTSALPNASAPDSLAAVFYTSGTTGTPKRVARSHRVVLSRVWLAMHYEALTPDDRQTCLTHFAYGRSQTDLFGTLLQGATLCLFDVVSEGLTALRTWLHAEGITVFHPPVVLFRRFLEILDTDTRFPSVRLVLLGGDVVLPSDLERWRRHFVPPGAVHNRFSTTETGLLTIARATHASDNIFEIVDTGQPVVGKTLTVVGDEGNPLPQGEAGELVVTMPAGKDGIETHRTGDLGRLLPDGRFQLIGRRDHQVKIRGFRVNTREVEAALLKLDDIAEAAVVTATDDDEPRLLAFVVMRPGQSFDAQSVRQRLGTTLPEWKVPARTVVVDSLPTTPSGKIDRQRLMAIDEEQRATTSASDTPVSDVDDELERQIAAAFRTVLRVPRISRADDFFLRGGDSLQATLLHLHIERAIGQFVPMERLFERPTVVGMANLVREVQRSSSALRMHRPRILVPLRATGRHTPLFLVHGRPGRAFAKQHVLDVLGVEQPVYAFQAAGLDLSRPHRNTIEEMARQYLQAMRAIQPRGPYFIGSLCAGGLVCLEMANQLRSAGESVGPLLLIDPPAIVSSDLPWWRRSGRLIKVWCRRALLSDTSDAPTRVTLAFEMARLKTRRWSYDGPVLLLRSADRMRRDRADAPFSLVRHLTGAVEWFEVGATHRDVQREGNLVMEHQLRQAVEHARRALADLKASN